MISIRNELPADIESIRIINEKAFGRPQEASVVDKIRKNGALVISLVALKDGKPVGHIAFTDIHTRTGLIQASGLPHWGRLPCFRNFKK